MEGEKAEIERLEFLRRAVYAAVVTRGKDGASVVEVMGENIQVVWPGSRVPATQKMVQGAIEIAMPSHSGQKKKRIDILSCWHIVNKPLYSKSSYQIISVHVSSLFS